MNVDTRPRGIKTWVSAVDERLGPSTHYAHPVSGENAVPQQYQGADSRQQGHGRAQGLLTVTPWASAPTVIGKPPLRLRHSITKSKTGTGPQNQSVIDTQRMIRRPTRESSLRLPTAKIGYGNVSRPERTGRHTTTQLRASSPVRTQP